MSLTTSSSSTWNYIPRNDATGVSRWSFTEFNQNAKLDRHTPKVKMWVGKMPEHTRKIMRQVYLGKDKAITAKSTRVAIVTGASRGLGRAIALALAEAGCALVLTARDVKAMEEVAAEADERGAAGSMLVPADLSLPGSPRAIIDQAVEFFGRIDILVNNAGDTQRGDFLDLEDGLHLSGFALKYHATVRMCRTAWTYLEESKGCIVNIAGIGAQTPEAQFSIGGPVNSALINFSKAVSKRKGAPRVNVVCPGNIETDRLARRIDIYADQNGLSREDASRQMRENLGIDAYGKPEDVASMVRYLCSPDASYITGATFTVDGGATLGI